MKTEINDHKIGSYHLTKYKEVFQSKVKIKDIKYSGTNIEYPFSIFVLSHINLVTWRFSYRDGISTIYYEKVLNPIYSLEKHRETRSFLQNDINCNTTLPDN